MCGLIISVVICEDTLLTTRGIFLDKMVHKNVLTYKVCRFCRKLFTNTRKNGYLLGTKQASVQEWCGRKCANEFRRKFPPVYYDNNYCYLLLNDKQFKFSPKHLDRVIRHSWYEGVLGYAESRINDEIVRLHTFVFGKDKILKVDHINRDKTDNRDENLRFVTHSENLLNSRVQDNPLRAIEKSGKRYKVRFKRNRVKYTSKSFIHIEDAIAFRDKLLYDLERRNKL